MTVIDGGWCGTAAGSVLSCSAHPCESSQVSGATAHIRDCRKNRKLMKLKTAVLVAGNPGEVGSAEILGHFR